MSGEVVSHDPLIGTSLTIATDADGNEVYKHSARLDGIVEANKAMRSEQTGSWGDGKIVASVPLTILMSPDFQKAIQNNDQQWLSRWLNNSDNRVFRTKEGVV